MKKTYIIGENMLSLNASAGALIHYKKQFGIEYTDELSELKGLADSDRKYLALAQAGLRLLWSMARAADRTIAEPEIWAAQFEVPDLAMLISEARELFISTLAGSDSGSAQGGRPFSSESLLAYALACGMQTSELDDIPLPMLLETLSQWCRLKGGEDNDDARPAEQTDFDEF